jgi:hypothetical protein
MGFLVDIAVGGWIYQLSKVKDDARLDEVVVDKVNFLEIRYVMTIYHFS